MRRLWVIVPILVVLGAGALFLQQRARMERAAHAARESALRDALSVIRTSIENFRQDKNRYPSSLEELVPNYLRRIPVDPISGSPWRVTTEETVQPSDDFSASSAPKTTSAVIDVHSTAPGYTDY